MILQLDKYSWQGLKSSWKISIIPLLFRFRLAFYYSLARRQRAAFREHWNRGRCGNQMRTLTRLCGVVFADHGHLEFSRDLPGDPTKNTQPSLVAVPGFAFGDHPTA